jgi:hypothetical protein
MKYSKAVPFVGLLMFCFMLAAQSAKAGDITFNDATDVLSVSGATCGSIFAPIPESCTVTLTAPTGYSFGSTTLPFLYLIGEGTGINAKISDSIAFLPGSNSVTLTFLSDADGVVGLPCSPFGVGRCNITEDGTVQTAGTITWTKSGSADIVDTIKFQSDVVPEPASLMLFGSGLGIAAVFLRRRRRQVTSSV